MSADVEIVLDAEDRATAKLRAAAAQLEATGKKIKTTGDATKRSTELFGQFAGLLGGNEIASAASQFAGLTEKVSGFSDVLKAGNAGALAFKAGLAGLVGVIAFQLGKSLGDIIFQTQKWEEALEKARKKSVELDQALLRQMGRSFEDLKIEVELSGNVEEQAKAYEEMLKQLNINLGGAEANLRNREQELEAQFNDPSSMDAWTTSAADRKRLVEEALAGDRERLKLMTEQRNEILRLLNAEKETAERRAELAAQQKATQDQERLNESSEKYIQNLRTQNELLAASRDKFNEMTAMQNTASEGDAALAKQLLDQQDAIKLEQQRKAEADNTITSLQQQLEVLRLGREEYERQQQLAAATTDEERKQIAALQEQIAISEDEQVIDALRQQLELLQLGSEEYERRKQLAEATTAEGRKQIADLQAQIAASKDMQKLKDAEDAKATTLQATTGRLLTRGRSDDPNAKIEENTKMTVKELQRLNTRQGKRVRVRVA